MEAKPKSQQSEKSKSKSTKCAEPKQNGSEDKDDSISHLKDEQQTTLDKVEKIQEHLFVSTSKVFLSNIVITAI